MIKISRPKYTIRLCRIVELLSNWLSRFCWGNRGSLRFLLIIIIFFSHIQSVNQSNKFFHFVYRSQIWKNLKYLRLKTRGFTPRCAFWGYCCWQIMFRGPNSPKNLFGVRMGLSNINHQKMQNRLTWKLLSRSWRNFYRVYPNEGAFVGGLRLPITDPRWRIAAILNHRQRISAALL